MVVVVVSIIAAIAVVDIDSVDSRFCEALNITFWVSKHLKCRLMRPTTEFKIHWDTDDHLIKFYQINYSRLI